MSVTKIHVDVDESVQNNFISCLLSNALYLAILFRKTNDVFIFKNANGFPGYTKWPHNYCNNSEILHVYIKVLISCKQSLV